MCLQAHLSFCFISQLVLVFSRLIGAEKIISKFLKNDFSLRGNRICLQSLFEREKLLMLNS